MSPRRSIPLVASIAALVGLSLAFPWEAAVAQSRRQPVYAVTKDADEGPHHPGSFGRIAVYEARDGRLTPTGMRNYVLGCVPPPLGADQPGCPPQPRPVAAGDLNGNGSDELVLADSSIFERFIDVEDVVGFPIALFDSGEELPSVATGDWDGDGIDDIAAWKDGRLHVYDEGGALKASFVLTPFDDLWMGNVEGDQADEFLVRRGFSLELIRPGGSFIRTLGIDNASLAVGDVDADGLDELALRLSGPGEGITVEIREADGTLQTSFVVPGQVRVGQIGLADMLGGPEAEILLGLRSSSALHTSLVLFDIAGNELTRLNGALSDISGPVTLVTGRGGPQDGDDDGLPDSWETSGLRLLDHELRLADFGATPDHKDLFVELDRMHDPDQRETGDGDGGSCGDMIDNDMDGIIDNGDPDCVDPDKDEITSGACTDGKDNNGDGRMDIFDPGCSIVVMNFPEGPAAPPGSCNDAEDNDGDGKIDRGDEDCRVLDPNGFEGSGRNLCNDGFDNDADGDTDADDSDCYDAGRDEAPAASCGDGLDNDGDGRIDADDLDCVTVPRQAAIRSIKQAFCAAPFDAAGGVPNPDGVSGIRFWVDVGDAPSDLNGFETPIRPCSCGDGLDNDGDGFTDKEDFDCRTQLAAGGPIDQFDASRSEFATSGLAGSCRDGLDNDGDGDVDGDDVDCGVGDDFGGGRQLTTETFCDLDDTFYDFRKDEFDAIRRPVFHYGISGTSCPDSGGMGEVGGNDFATFSRAGRALMHEVGHNLSLHHGGGDEKNCKPNYMSMMNYSTGRGLQRRSGQQFLDFAPPRFPGGRGAKVLPDVLEDELVEAGFALDPSDAFTQFIHTDPRGAVVMPQMDGDQDGDGSLDGTNWNNDPANLFEGAIDPINLNLASASCKNERAGEKFESHDDWSNIRLGLRWGRGRGEPDSDEGPVEEVSPPELTESELRELRLRLRAADLRSAKSGPSEVEVGDPVTYTLTISNQGPSVAAGTVLEDLLAARTTLVSAPAECSLDGRTLVCPAGGLGANQSQEVTVVVDTDDVCVDGVPPALQNRVQARHAAAEDRELDRRPDNDAALVITQAIDTTPPIIDCNAPTVMTPREAPITLTAEAADLCDDAVQVEVVDFDCFAIKRKDRRVDKTESCIVEIDGTDVTILDSGGVGDRIVWSVLATDHAGNTATAQCEVVVVRASV
jgi:uncharacterized repeat protein (TIGR01451 family)